MAAPEAAAAAAAGARVVDIQPLLPDEKATEQLWALYCTHPVLQSVLDLKVQYEGLVDRAKHNNPVISGKEFTWRRKEIAKHYPKFPPTLDARDWLSQALFIYHGRDVATANLLQILREKHGPDALSFLGNYGVAAQAGAEVDLQFYHNEKLPALLPLPYTEPKLSRRVVETIATVARQLKKAAEEAEAKSAA